MDDHVLPHAVITRAVNKAELSVKMQRDFLLKEYAAEIKAKKLLSRKKKYIANVGLLWRILHFLNGDRDSKIRKVELPDSELLAAENMALSACTNISNLEFNSDMACRLRKDMYDKLEKRELHLNASQLQFVRSFNPEAFKAKQKQAQVKAQGEQGGADTSPS